MEAAIATLVFLPGLAFGSFLGVVAARVPRGASIVRPRSQCMACEAPLAWYDNIPLISFAALRGRCRNCRVRIPLREPAVELVTALCVVGCALAFGLTLHALAAAVFCCALIVVSATDLERRVVPNRVVLPAAAAVLALQTLADPSPEWALGALGAAGFLFLVAFAYPAGMGMGDVKLALLIGAMVGRSAAVALMLATVLALVPSAALFARHGSRARKLAIPFAPFLAAGGLIALFAGVRLLHLYLGSFT